MVYRDRLLQFARNFDFDIHDLAVINGVECVAKKMNDSESYIYWPLEKEGSGCYHLLKGFSKTKEDWTPRL